MILYFIYYNFVFFSSEKCLSSAKMMFAIAHSHGVVWDMNWCPSGCDDDCNPSPNQSSLVRMGLLAVACSNGKSYIYSIPKPSCLPHWLIFL